METTLGAEVIRKADIHPVICFLTLESKQYIMEVWRDGKKLFRKNLGSDTVEAFEDWNSELSAIQLQA